MFTRIKQFLISKYVKGILDKIPFNNYKSYLGILILILSAVKTGLGEAHIASPFLIAVLDILQKIDGVVPIQDAGIVVLVTGVIHKIIKKLGK